MKVPLATLLAIPFLGLSPSALAQATDPHATPHSNPHAGHDMHGMHDMKGMEDMAGMDMSPPTGEDPKGTDQQPGKADAPAMTHDRAADRYWNPAAMAAAERIAMGPPAGAYYQVVFDLAEYQIRNGADSYRWEGEAWVGDADRFVIKTEGEGTFGANVDHAEVQALYSKALDPWWNLQAGVRQDVRPTPARTWAAVGLEGRARYQFAAGAAAFLSDKGQLAGRIEGSYDQRLTQRLVLQPRVELNLTAQDMPEQRIGSGLSSTEVGLRLRYEIRREFAPYLGVSWTWLAGRTADYARADGHDPSEGSLVAGVRVWF